MPLQHYKNAQVATQVWLPDCTLCNGYGYARDINCDNYKSRKNCVVLCEECNESLTNMFPIRGKTLKDKIFKMKMIKKRLELNKKLKKIKNV